MNPPCAAGAPQRRKGGFRLDLSEKLYTSDIIYLDRMDSQTSYDLVVDHIGVSQNSPDACISHDRRDVHILHYVASGRGVFTCMGTDYPLSGGDIYLFPKNTNVAYRAEPSDPWVVHYVGFYGSKDDHYVRQLGLSAQNVALRRALDPQLLAFFNSMRREARSPNVSRASLAGYLYLIFGAILHKKEAPEDIAMPSGLFRVITNYVHNNIDQPLRIHNIAQAFHISESQLFRIFKAQCGLSLHQYIERERIALACNLLQKTQLPMQDIALRCGYAYESHFYKSFQKIVGTSPAKYRTEKAECVRQDAAARNARL